MNLEYYYWYFQSAIPPKICDDIIKYGLAQQEQIALTGGFQEKKDKGEELTEKETKDLSKKRKSNVVWMDEKWIYNEIHPYIHQANANASWNFEWDFSESCQFTKYKFDQFYDWHCDSWNKPYDKPDDPNSHGKIRKLSATVSLSDETEYEGGDFQFNWIDTAKKDLLNITTVEDAKDIGTVIVFPSFIWHQILPITKGKRESLVNWSIGTPFI